MSERENRRGLVAGLILIITGLIFLLINFGLVGGNAFLIALGASFLVGFGFNRNPGLLIPGMILIWLGFASILLDSNLLELQNDDSIIVIALGLTFISIYALLGQNRHFWPLIPGGILLVVGTTILLTSENLVPISFTQLINILWPIALIALGIWFIVRQFLRR
ncbi:MAG: hypothetical protein HY779_03310 [Rubrobacteridae bacterium]|nr:hypothetical protein [Rubrobacteridae bacterium]